MKPTKEQIQEADEWLHALRGPIAQLIAVVEQRGRTAAVKEAAELVEARLSSWLGAAPLRDPEMDPVREALEKAPLDGHLSREAGDQALGEIARGEVLPTTKLPWP